MKKTIQFLSIIVLVLVLVGLIIFFFNPFNTRNRIIGSMINYYFQIDSLKESGTFNTTADNINDKKNNPENQETTGVQDKNPLLTEEQEKKLESFGVDVMALPKEITPGMSACFVEKLGEQRAMEIVAGGTPGPLEIIKTKECLSK